MKIQWIESPGYLKTGAFFRVAEVDVDLRASHETATGDASEPHESRAEQEHARGLWDVDVGVSLGGGRKNGDRGRRGRDRLLRLNRGRANAVRLARESRRARDDADTSYDQDGKETNEQRTRIHLV
jgi:hypothetical protein